MYYFEVYVAEHSYLKSTPLTYSFHEKLEPGSIVEVPFKSKTILGFVAHESAHAPAFKTKPISSFVGIVLSKQARALHDWLQIYYPKSAGSITQLFLQNNVSKKNALKEPECIKSLKNTAKIPELSSEQVNALEKMNTKKTYVVHGETGSGKTRLYSELIKRVTAKNKSALVLVPEIGLTSSVAQEISRYVSVPIFIAHSNQTQLKRRTLWNYIASSVAPFIVVAPRSGLFLPFKNLGAVIVDEFHDSSYKHEQPPHFSATKVASVLAKSHDAYLLLGSATPPLEDYYFATQKDATVLRLKNVAKKSEHKTSITVVDLKNRQDFSKNRYVSNKLLQEVTNAINNKQQALILLNRRGSARVTLCEQCDWLATCPKCETPLTYHGDIHQLRCHTCGFKTPSPSSCPMCKSVDIAFKSIGTKSLESFFKAQFPSARISRFDGDTAKSDKLENVSDALKNGDVDILIGTQMLAKGLDLPNLRVVGVVIADSGLFFPDFTAREKTFQLLYQVIGRVGRGHNDGVVIIQSYSPNSDIIKQSCERNWEQFYQTELHDRKSYFLPPFSYLLKLTIRRKTLSSCQENAEKIAKSLASSHPRVRQIGPGPAFIEKQAGNHIWHLVLCSTKRKELIEIIQKLPSNVQFDIDPSDLL